MDTPLLSVEQVVAGYGHIVALKGVSCEVRPGEIVAVLGANGAGKSSLLRVVGGLLTPRQGNVLFEGRPIISVPAHQRAGLGITLVPEGRRIFGPLSVIENLRLGAYQQPHAHVKERLEFVLAIFPVLRDRLDQKASTLSGGQQQMLAIGQALMSSPRLFMLDEPSLGLAPLVVQDIYAALRDLNKHGLTILLVEQNASLAFSVAHRCYVLEVGQVALHGPSAEIHGDSAIVEAYLGGRRT